jgi:AcrR family transcriptional regulator
MARNYTLKRRAEAQAETRRRIVEAAVELHSTVGPAAATVSMIAQKAGVQRNTFYAHFPDAWSVVMACSGHVMENDPLPDPEPWEAL